VNGRNPNHLSLNLSTRAVGSSELPVLTIDKSPLRSLTFLQHFLKRLGSEFSAWGGGRSGRFQMIPQEWPVQATSGGGFFPRLPNWEPGPQPLYFVLELNLPLTLIFKRRNYLQDNNRSLTT
jgi:hypothetical protein